MLEMPEHQPLHLLPEHQSLLSAGRLRRAEDQWRIYNAHIDLGLEISRESTPTAEFSDGALVRVGGHRRGEYFVVEYAHIVQHSLADRPALQSDRAISIGDALRARHGLNRRLRRFFDERHFLEVETPAWVREPGTDPHIEPVRADFQQTHDTEEPQPAYLHTSPELAMKRLLAAGSGPIYQLGPVWRNGEVTPLHNPEFRLLEWYRPWQPVEAIMDDVEALVTQVLHEHSARPVGAPFSRMTMRQLVDQACGFDILNALDVDSLRREIQRHDLLSDRAMRRARWDELFYSLTVSHLDPFLSSKGAVFVTDWPAPLAILARRKRSDERVAERFELYVDGVELANGFGELTDPQEQRRRFEEDNTTRRRLGHRPMPIPQAFLRALRWGLPPSSGVALGVDRLLLLATPNASCLRDIAPFALTRNVDGIDWPG